ncbi:ferric-chelate reductase [Marasmius crinis-equi]|uniref:Ferric-chelate reductase n=1 Tax=Marasmius crinis-equi TaxID=585013 RepID=A0ABR3FZB9_9AGAR
MYGELQISRDSPLLNDRAFILSLPVTTIITPSTAILVQFLLTSLWTYALQMIYRLFTSIANDEDFSTNVAQGELKRQNNYQKHLNPKFAIALNCLALLVVLIRAITIRTPLYKSFSTSPSTFTTKLKPRAYPRFHITPFRAFDRYEITIPIFSQTLSISAFSVVVLACLSLGYNWREGHVQFTPPLIDLTRWLALRWGTITVSLLPLAVLTAARQNFLVWLTGWSHNSWNVFHRWVGRLMFFGGLGHGLLYTTYAVLKGQFLKDLQKYFWILGFCAFATLCILATIPSVRFMRNRSYEVFIAVHVISSAAFVILLCYHTKWKRSIEWIYLALLLWGFDRIARLLKSGVFPHKGHVTHNRSSMRLDVNIPGGIRIAPGQFAHIRLPQISYVQSHPFSIAAVFEATTSSHRHRSSSANVSDGEDSMEETPLVADREAKSGRTTQRVTFLIRPHDGFTRKLYDHILSAPSRPVPVQVFFEGPYGYQHDLSRHTSLIFLAGGVGVTYTLPYLLKLPASMLEKQRLRFVWVLRALEEIESILDILEEIPNELAQFVDFYYTGRMASLGVMLDSSGSDEHRRWLRKVRIGRPIIGDLLSTALEKEGGLGLERASVVLLGSCIPSEIVVVFVAD